MAAEAKAKKEEPAPGVPEWVVTYGDMMSLLLTFFIMLVSMSEMKEDGELRAALDAIRETFGDSAGSLGAPGTSAQTTSILNKLGSLSRASLRGAKKDALKTPIRTSGGKFQMVKKIRNGTRVTLGGSAMFAAFDAELTDDLRGDLDIIVQALSKKNQRIEVRGHASPEPIPDDGPFEDHFDLSFARAYNVAEYLISKGLGRDRLLLSAAGDTEPRTRKKESEHQALNRRVDVFLLDSYIGQSSK